MSVFTADFALQVRRSGTHRSKNAAAAAAVRAKRAKAQAANNLGYRAAFYARGMGSDSEDE